jgi:hypothetical protein
MIKLVVASCRKMSSMVGGFPKDIEGILYPTIAVHSQQ